MLRPRRTVCLLATFVMVLACETKPSAGSGGPSATTDASEPVAPEPVPPEPKPDPFDIGEGKPPVALTSAQIDAPIPTEPPALDFWTKGEAACEPGGKLDGAAPPQGREIRCVDDQGRWTGMDARFHENGQLQMIGRRQDARMVGVWLWFHPNGAKASEHPYVDGELHGTVRRFAENGQEIEQGEYRAGRAWGLFVYHDENGKELARAQLVRGTGRLVNASESRRTESEYVDGLMHGKHRAFDANGVLLEESEWSGGEMHGVEVRFDAEGRKRAEEHWKQGERHGYFTQWKDGQIIEQSIWVDGKQRSRQLFLDAQPLAPLPTPTACDDDAGLSNYLASARGEGLPDQHACVSREPLFPGVVLIGDFAYDRGCMGSDWVVDCKLASPGPTTAELLARAGWARANAEQRITIASAYLQDFGLGNERSIVSDPSKPEWTVLPDGGVEGVMWVQEPSGMRRGSEKDKIRFTFAPDGSSKREVLEHVSTLE
jgi:antitoxin component YwqK of YwqJK toxin-antitoxin module